ncbi:HAD family hydrolase [Brachybacterium saurashtrense]|uniref:HAD family hydrolase n=1 Tax=Brachybacterium saurashtrense TaxID=556288 RepID=A0A345YMD9_9MICO|nr:HAD-IA family hydrolase [Brachybacterium saurashtrense]AXK45091.1 HAD family hydrolase [Brachybacterium saurashtrense]RRR21775.1 HAD family hydrolase [Brachybacterium saurashtrense]
MRAVIWDLGGTLVDTYPDVDRALAGALSPAPGEELLHEVALLTRRSSGEAIRTLAARHHVSEELLQDAYERTKEVWEEHPPPVMDGARELLEAVREAGGLNLVATHRHRESASALLERLALEVDDLVCAPDGFARKPSPQMLRTLLARHDLAPRDCLAVGDRTADVEAAAAAGVPAQLLETPGVPLDAAGADRLRSLRALIALFPAPGAQGGAGH